MRSLRARVGVWVAAAVAVALSGAGSAAALGEPAGAVAVDAFVLSGDAGSDIESALRRGVLRGLADEGALVVDVGAGAPVGPCTNAECAAALAAASGADFVIGGKALISERNYEVTLELHGRDGRILVTKAASCPICSVPEAEQAVARAAAALVEALNAPPPAAEPLRLAIESSPPGAIVYLDGVVVGATPYAGPVVPGPHRVELRMEGYRPHVHELRVEPEGAPAPVAVALVAQRRRLQLAPLGWAAVGVGAAALVTGAVLVAFDERPFTALCDGDNVDAAGRCRLRYDTLAGGVAGLVGGAVLAGGGAALIVLDRKRRGDRGGGASTAELRLGIQPRGFALGGRF